jgi:uncharacterized membrane protein
MAVLQSLSLVLAGLLAGIEFIVRYGVQPALTRLDDVAHLRARQQLILRLRVIVPAIMLPNFLLATVVLVVGGEGSGMPLRVAAVAALLVMLLASFLGTVPLNIRVDGWDAEHPPADWRVVVRRWEQVDVLRSSAAIAGFVLLVLASA